MPKRKTPLFPHVSGRKQQVNKESYYWTAINKDTGEIAEYSTPYATPDLALQAGENFASETWGKDTALIEVWTQPHRYSEKLAIQAVASKTITASSPKEIKTATRIRYDRSSLESAIAAAKRLQADKDKYDRTRSTVFYQARYMGGKSCYTRRYSHRYARLSG